jgi:HD-GYP domain-containing protein (c-di-GMP phosphodiesterase class II)
VRLAREVAPELTTDAQLEFGFLLHDIGKIGVPDAIILKPGSLDHDELGQMRGHVALGQRIIAEIPYLGGVAAQVVASRHERWDGTGYPQGLRGEDIPLAARIFAVVDAFDAMTNDRPYRWALSAGQALKAIANGANTQFDPNIAQAFITLMSETQAESWQQTG